MKSVPDIILQARKRTGNEDWDYNATTGETDQGLDQSILVDAINDAQDHLQAVILETWPNQFEDQETFSIVGDQQEYTLTERAFNNGKFILVNYSGSSNASDYDRALQWRATRDRRYYTGTPEFYTRSGNQALLSPVPKSSQGLLLITYYRELDDLDIVRAEINGTPSGANITIQATTPEPDDFGLGHANYICVSDRFGNVLLYNGIVDSYSSPTITLAANVDTYLTTGTVLADLDGAHVTIGKWTTTHSKLPDGCERYLRVYVQKRALTFDESNSSLEEDAELLKIEKDIFAAFGDESKDVEEIPIVDWEIMI